MRISDWSSDVCSSDLPIFEENRGVSAGLDSRSASRHAGTIETSFLPPGDAQHRLNSPATARRKETIMGNEGSRSLPAQHPCAPRRVTSEAARRRPRSEEHTSELQSLMRISYAVFD